MHDVLSTRELAEAIGVSESSIKRWADEGVIRASRTAGGHRRILLTEAIRFIRASRSTVVRPDILGLPEAALVTSDVHAPADESERLFGYLIDGAAASARGLLTGLYLRGDSTAEIVDGPVSAAMTRIGALWQHEPEGVFVEHRATDICIQAVNQLRLLAPSLPGRPRAVGGALAGDPYVMPSLAAAAVLEDEGFEAINLGADTPVPSLLHAVDSIRPALVWASISFVPNQASLVRELETFAQGCRQRGVPAILGGQEAAALRAGRLRPLHVGRTMAELAAFARGLAVAAPEPSPAR